jgi:hypothetical protein
MPDCPASSQSGTGMKNLWRNRSGTYVYVYIFVYVKEDVYAYASVYVYVYIYTVYKCRNARLSGIRSVRYQNEKKLTVLEQVQY